MLGAVIGDIAGSRFEFDNYRDTDFEIFHPDSLFTDDTVCNVAIAQWLMNQGGDLVKIMRSLCRRYMVGYGDSFHRWLVDEWREAYNSWGNGSAMRVSAVGWAFNSLAETLDYAQRSVEIMHNYPEGIKGAKPLRLRYFGQEQGKYNV
ncbi:ADP-ribosylglycohydrolase family protein [Lonepinella sp. BR2271]|uniref:ADP-ribosylglycohydrolase family protein n=1 Tax=Lonepinella sp. BR2271 TaxID=3434550 RepID=UPI003F6DA882